MEEMITGQEITERSQRKQSFCTGLSQSCPLANLQPHLTRKVLSMQLWLNARLKGACFYRHNTLT